MKLSVCLATFNEQRNLGGCLDSVKDIAGEIIVVDGNSSDKTVEIARQFKASIITSDNNPVFHIQKQKAINEAKGEWILQLDADERVSDSLKQEIKTILKTSPPIDGYWINRKKQFLGHWVSGGGQYPDPVIRLFRKGKGRLPQNNVHEQIEIKGTTGRLQGELIHLPSPSFATYITKDNRYSTLFALELLKLNPGTGIIQFLQFFLLLPFVTFFSIFIRHKGFKDGFPGFVFAFYSGLTRASAYVKYWEYIHHPSSNNPQADWV